MACINVFSLHYFLWFSALTSIYGYISVYAKHYANATASEYGLLNMVLPFVTIVAKLFFCSLADRHQAYRSIFIVFLISSLVGFGSFGVLPIFISPPEKESGLNLATWILICIMTSISTISMSVISCLSDAFAVNSSKKHDTNYGFIRLWGTIGWGLSSFILAFINQTKNLPFLVPGLIMTIILLASDVVVAMLWPYSDDFTLDKSASGVGIDSVVSAIEKLPVKLVDRTSDLTAFKGECSEPPDYGATKTTTKDASNEQTYESISPVKIQWILFKEVASRRRSLFRYMILFTISGALISIQWSYFFLFLEKIYEADFSFISGLSMVGQSFLGELPFFLISKPVIQYLGRSFTLSFSIMSIGVRYLLYEYLLPNSSMYFVLLSESLQGPSFGLFYVVMTEVGLDYSDCEEAIVNIVNRGVVGNNPTQIEQLRQALRATMQSLMSACYEGLGLGIGSIVGGIVIDQYGFSFLWLWSSVIAIVLGLTNLMIEMLHVPILVDRKQNVILSVN